jgi:hypothetical protein
MNLQEIAELNLQHKLGLATEMASQIRQQPVEAPEPIVGNEGRALQELEQLAQQQQQLAREQLGGLRELLQRQPPIPRPMPRDTDPDYAAPEEPGLVESRLSFWQRLRLAIFS